MRQTCTQNVATPRVEQGRHICCKGLVVQRVSGSVGTVFSRNSEI